LLFLLFFFCHAWRWFDLFCLFAFLFLAFCQTYANSVPSQSAISSVVARPKKSKAALNGIALTASGSAVAPAVVNAVALVAKKPRKPTVKKEKDDAGSNNSVTPLATPEKPEKPERGKGRPRKIRPLEPGTAAAAAAVAAGSIATVTAASVAVAAASGASAHGATPSVGGGTPNAAASSSSASHTKNLSSVTARRRQEKEENAPFPWKPNSVKPIRMDPRTGAIAVGDPDAPCPPGFVDCWPCPEQGCNERHASDRQLATHIRMAHDDGKWRCPLYPSECNKTYKLAHHVALHYSGVHEGVRHHACTWEGCGLFFLNRGGLMQHYNFIHLKRNVDPRNGKLIVGSPTLATISAPSGKPSKRKRGRSVDDSVVPGGVHAAVSDGDELSTAPESPISVRRSASTMSLSRGRPRNNAAPVDRGTRADEEDDDDDEQADDDDDEDDEHVGADGHAQPDAARRASESQWRAEAAAAAASQRLMMRASAPHPALEMDFDIHEHQFDSYKHSSAFEAPTDTFGFLPTFADDDAHATMMLQSDDMLAHDTFGAIHHDLPDSRNGASDRKSNGHFGNDVDALALDEDHFGNGQSLAIPPV
jgi:hypothetical protein